MGIHAAAQALEHLVGAGHQRATAACGSEFFGERYRVRAGLQFAERLGGEFRLALALLQPGERRLGVGERVFARHVMGEAAGAIARHGKALAAAQRRKPHLTLPHRLSQTVDAAGKFGLHLTGVLQFGLQPRDGAGGLGRQILAALFEGGDGAGLQVLYAGGEAFGVFRLQPVLRDGDGNGTAGSLDPAGSIADLLGEDRKGMAIAESFFHLVGTAAHECQDLFEHSFASLYEHCSIIFSHKTEHCSIRKMNVVQNERQWLMAMPRQTKKEDLKTRLTAAGTALIREQGLKGLRARDIAERAGAALGGLYTVFDDLDGLILTVNSGTLKRLETALEGAIPPDATAEDTFLSLSLAYLRFALAERNLWSALFEHRMPEGMPVPDWHLAEHAFLIGLIAAPLAARMPDASAQDIAIRARTFFSAVHGVIAISLEGRFVGITPDVLEREVTALARMLAGSPG